MKTQQETERLQAVEKALNSMHELLAETFGDAAPPEMISVVLGSMLAAVDATFAIRDGESWRGLTEPKEIAARLLRDANLGDI